MTPPAPAAFAAFVGLDWAEATHDLCLQAAGAAPREFLQLDHRPAGIAAWGHSLHTRCNGQAVAGCLARKKGPRVSALCTDDCLGLFPVHPLTVAKYRAAFTPRRAPDEPTEAALQVARLRTPRDQLPPLVPPRPTRRALAPLVEHRRPLVGDTVRLPHRLSRALKHYCPHVLPGLQEQDTALFCDFLSRWPTLTAAPRARRATLLAFFHAHHVRAADGIAARLQALQSATPRPTEEGVIAPSGLRVQALVSQLRVTWHALTDCAAAMAQRAQAQPDCPVWAALPGAGAVFAPRRLVAVGAQRARYPSAEARQKYAGIAPVTKRRGKKSWGHWRLPGPQCLRHSCGAWAAASLRPACWAPVYYPPQRDKGKSHPAAVRALACKGSRMLLRCGQERPPYELKGVGFL
jgi:Transposase/Transposase IS116/IS110/IS902 family